MDILSVEESSDELKFTFQADGPSRFTIYSAPRRSKPSRTCLELRWFFSKMQKGNEDDEMKMMNKTPVRSHVLLPDGREITIRRPGPQDEQGLLTFFDSLGSKSRRHFLPHATTAPVIRRRIERAILDEDRVYLAWDGETVAGYFFLWNFTEPVPLLGIGITDSYQGLKLGQQFMAILIEDAREANRDGIELTTMQDNDRAFYVYQKMGFQYLRDVENETGDGTIVIERAMFLPLREGAQPMTSPHRCPE